MARSLTGPGNIAKLGDTMLGPFNEAKAPDVASASTVNLIVTKGNLVDITGTATILSMVLAPGAERVLRFVNSLRLTNSASLVLPGGEDIITTPNDMAIVRGYPNGVVRFVTYSRANGYVQRVGDKLSGTLTFAPGNTVSPPIRYQVGSLTTIKVANSCEWDGTNMYLTTADSTRKQVLYTDGDGSKLTSFSSKQITDALGYTPFDPNSTPNRISPNGGLLEAGQYVDLHYVGSGNDYDVRLEVGAPVSGSGTSTLHVGATQINVNGSKVWTENGLTNLNQLTNGPGYAPSANPTFTGQVQAPQGSPAVPGIAFDNPAQGKDTGFYSASDGVIGVASNGKPVAKFTYSGLNLPVDGSGTAGLSLDANSGSTLSGPVRIDVGVDFLRFYDSISSKGAYLDIKNSASSIGSQILTSTQMTADILSGYQKLPSGLILQWGRRYNTGTVGHGWVNFPITFPVTVLNVQTTYIGFQEKGDYRGSYGSTAAGAYIPTDNCDTWWFAIGY
jgi:hypothetical protein